MEIEISKKVAYKKQLEDIIVDVSGNGGKGGFTPEESEQFKGALYDLAERLRKAADNFQA